MVFIYNLYIYRNISSLLSASTVTPWRQLTASVQNVLTENDNYVTEVKEKQAVQ